MSRVHVFPYSPRPGTPGAAMAGAAEPDVRRERAARLRDVSERAGFAHRRARVGGRDDVLVERIGPQGEPSGLGADYTRFVLPAGAGGPGRVVPVAVEAVRGEHLVGRPLEAS